jgi:hypothetical protein
LNLPYQDSSSRQIHLFSLKTKDWIENESSRGAFCERMWKRAII